MYYLTVVKNQIRSDTGEIFFLSDSGSSFNNAYSEWIANGNAPLPAPLYELSISVDKACDNHYDSVAAARGWGRVGITPSAACSARAGYPNPWQAEAIKFCQWVDSCVAYLIAEKAKVVSGARTMPTTEQAIAELPPMVW